MSLLDPLKKYETKIKTKASSQFGVTVGRLWAEQESGSLGPGSRSAILWVARIGKLLNCLIWIMAKFEEFLPDLKTLGSKDLR